MNAAFGQPFYVLGNSQDLSSQVLKTNPLETQDSYKVNGTMKDVGNISETGTYVSTYRPGQYIVLEAVLFQHLMGRVLQHSPQQTKASRMPMETLSTKE